MADNNAESGAESQVTFKVKTSGDSTHTITMAESATVLDLKTKLAGADFENIPVDRQRLIYSGRVLKNDDTLATYKIKQNNTIHMVKSAASNPSQPASTSASAPAAPAVPTNMASGTANNPLAGLTGARYAGHQINLPGLDMFGPDGGMGPPMDEERLQRMMEDPNVQQSMNEALNNDDFINMLIQSNPMLRNMPNAREIITSPFMRQMMSNPSMIGQAMRMQRNMEGASSAFPAPGATDTTPADAAASGDSTDRNADRPYPANPFEMPYGNPFAMLGGMGAGQQGNNGQGNLDNMTQNLQQLLNALRPPQGQGSNPAQPGQGANDSEGTTTGQAQGEAPRNVTPPAGNPFSALFPGAGGAQPSPFGLSPETMRQMLQMMSAGGQGGGFPGAAAPPDNRPPEERYAEQLRQLNDMGFYDFDRNVAALRRSGGSVQGAVEHLLSSTD
jgi:ubiquilin